MKLGRPTLGAKPLRPIQIRLDEADIRVARKVARAERLPYQRVIRAWIKQGAEAARSA